MNTSTEYIHYNVNMRNYNEDVSMGDNGSNNDFYDENMNINYGNIFILNIKWIYVYYNVSGNVIKSSQSSY